MMARVRYTNKKSGNVYLLQGLYCISTNNKGTSIEKCICTKYFQLEKKLSFHPFISSHLDAYCRDVPSVHVGNHFVH